MPDLTARLQQEPALVSNLELQTSATPSTDLLPVSVPVLKVESLSWRLRGSGPVRILKTIGVAFLLTLLFMSFQLLTHFPTGLIAPISAGLTTGGVMRVTPRVAFIVGAFLFLVVSLPAPIAYLYFGFANHLPFVAIAVFSFVFGAYYGTLIGVFSWLGGKMKPWEPMR